MDMIAYIRVSTTEQGISGLGLEAQRRAILQAAGHRDWQLTFIEDTGSGKDLNRPGLTGALSTLREGRAAGLVIAKLDRLSRSLIDFAALMERARRERWALVSLDLGVDTSTPQGEMLANVMATFAQFERRLISERTKAALAVLRAQGRQLGRPPVLSPTVRAAIGQWSGAGASLGAIAGHLNATGVPTAHGGRQWWPSTVRAVLRSCDRLPPCRWPDPVFEVVETPPAANPGMVS